ncbi:hypothetical protein AOLI_G00026440 [Acnodon oligacanthus]
MVSIMLLPSLQFLRQQFITTRSSSRHWGQQKLQTGRGRNRLSTDRDDRQLIRMSVSNWRTTSSDLQKEWQMAAQVKCTARTVRNRLLEAGLKSCKARKKLFINKKQRRARLKFAKDHKYWTIEDWSKVIFSDESNLQLCPTPGRLTARRRPGKAYKPQCLTPTVKFGGGSVMIWGRFSQAGIGQIRLCKGRMNQATYKIFPLMPETSRFPRKKPASSTKCNRIYSLQTGVKEEVAQQGLAVETVEEAVQRGSIAERQLEEAEGGGVPLQELAATLSG